MFDTNVWISGLAFRGRVRPLIEEAIQRGFEVAVSRELLDELAGVLEGRKFGYSHEAIAALLQEIRKLARVVTPMERVKAVPTDPSDDRVLECALVAGADAVVSGDRHLLALGEFRGIRIMTPDAFLREIKGGEGKPPGTAEPAASYRTRGGNPRSKSRSRSLVHAR